MQQCNDALFSVIRNIAILRIDLQVKT